MENFCWIWQSMFLVFTIIMQDFEINVANTTQN